MRASAPSLALFLGAADASLETAAVALMEIQTRLVNPEDIEQTASQIEYIDLIRRNLRTLVVRTGGGKHPAQSGVLQ